MHTVSLTTKNASKDTLCILKSRLEKAKRTVKCNFYGNLLVPVNITEEA